MAKSSGGDTLGSASLYLGLNSSALTRGLKSVHGEITRGIGDLQGLIGGGLSVGVKGLAGGLAAVGVAGAAGLGAFSAATFEAKERIEELSKVAKAGDAFGLSAESGTGLFGLLGQAGSDSRDASEGLVTLGARVREALSGSGEVAAKLFEGLNVGAEKFAGLNPADQFYLLLDSLSKVQDPATRVGLLLKAVGEDTGKNLMPLLGKTGAEARQMAAGFALSAGELSKMAGATSAITKMESKFDRLKTKLAVAASPFIESVAASFDSINVEAVGAKFEKVYSVATDVFTRVKDYAADQFAKLSTDLDSFLTKTVAPAVKTTDDKGNPAVSQFAKSVADFGRYVGKVAGDTVDNTSGTWNAFSYMFDSVAGSIQTNLGKLVGSRTLQQEGALLDAKALQSLDKAGKDFAGTTGEDWGKVGDRLGRQAGQALSEVTEKALTPPLKFAEAAIDLSLAAIEGAEKSLQQVATNAANAAAAKAAPNTAYLAGTADELSFRLRAMAPQGQIAVQQLAEAKKQSDLLREQTSAIRQWADRVPSLARWD